MKNKQTALDILEMERIAAKNRLDEMNGRKTKEKHSLEALQRDRTNKILAGDPTWTPIGVAAQKVTKKLEPRRVSTLLIASLSVAFIAGALGIII